MATNLAEVLDSDSLSLSIARVTLANALARIQSVVERRNTIPILGNVKMEVAGGWLTLTATDMDIEVSERVECKGTPGALTLPALMLYDIVRKLPEGAEVKIANSGKDGRVKISAGNSRFMLPTLPASDFPSIADGGFTHSFQLTAPQLQRLFDKTRFAMSTEETRYYLNGIYLHIPPKENTVLRTVATDGHRLAKNEIQLPPTASDMPGVIVPRKAVAELRKLMEIGAEEIQVSLGAGKVRFAANNLVLITKIIDGSFPDYERVIPTGNNKILELEPRSFAAAVDRVSTVSADKVRAIRFNLEGGKLTLTSTNPETGTATETIEVAYAAEPLDVGFNARYVLDVLDQIESDTAQFVFADSTSPVLIRDASDVGAVYVIMPMRI